MALFAPIITPVPTSKTWMMCGGCLARKAAMPAFSVSGYVPLKTGTTLYSLWVALNSFARFSTTSLLAPGMACHHWISVWAWAGTAVAPAMATRANAEAAIVAWMRCIYLVSLICGSWSWLATRDYSAVTVPLSFDDHPPVDAYSKLF